MHQVVDGADRVRLLLRTGELEEAQQAEHPQQAEEAKVGWVDVMAEHGIGTLKKPYLGHTRGPDEMALMRRIKTCLDPENILNPGKVFPTLHGCGELKTLHAREVANKFPDIPRF